MHRLHRAIPGGLLISLLACGPPPPPSTATASTATSASAEGGVPAALTGILAAHNRLRAQHCAPPLSWSVQIAQVAQHWADHLAAAGCSFSHSHGPYGENLAAASPGALTNQGVVDKWYREIGKYDFGHPGFSGDTGHFTQVVWAGSTQVGCGTTTCGGLRFWVCDYDPPGNVAREYRQNVQPPGCGR